MVEVIPLGLIKDENEFGAKKKNRRQREKKSTKNTKLHSVERAKNVAAPANLSFCALEQGTSIFPILLSFPLGSQRFPDDCVRRPVRPFPLCLLKFEPMIDSSVPTGFAWSPSSRRFTALPGVFSLFGQSGRYRSTSLALNWPRDVGGGGAGRFLLPPETSCDCGRQPRRRLLDCGDSPLPTDNLCTFQPSWPPLVDGTVTTSSPATDRQAIRIVNR